MKKRWVFCKNCGNAFETTSFRVQFCSKMCLNDWIKGKSSSNFGMTKNFGHKDKSRYNRWRHIVYKKFDNKCAICGRNDQQLHAHHITTWFENIELRYDTDNGVALCKNCHSCVHGYDVGSGKNIINDQKKIIKIRKKYIDITKVTYKARV